MDIEPNSSSVPPPIGSAYEQPPSYVPPPKKKMPIWAILLIIFGVCGCGCVPVLAAILFPVFSQARIAAKTTGTLSNIKQLNTAHMLYAADFDDVTMPADQWNERVLPFTKNPSVLEDPLLEGGGDKRGIGYNGLAAKKSMALFSNARDVVIFALTTQVGQDAKASKDSLRGTMSGPDQKTLVGQADGSARRLTIEEAQTLQWTPVLDKDE